MTPQHFILGGMCLIFLIGMGVTWWEATHCKHKVVFKKDMTSQLWTCPKCQKRFMERYNMSQTRWELWR